jgi:tetratricopeptide (TPR) repeat protein
MASGTPPKPPESPRFTPPGQLPGREAPGGNGKRWTGILLLAMLLLGLLVVFVLPDLVQRRAASPENPPAVVNPPTPAIAPAMDTAARGEAEQALRDYLELRARLELENVSAWGEPEWSRSTALADDGDRHFARQRFRPAADAYTAAKQGLQALAEGKTLRYEAAIDAGTRALADNDSETAVDRFELALAIRPEDPAALAGLQRARQRPGVLAHMQQGEAAEGRGDLAAARDAFAQAVAGDGDYEPAVTALQRVSEQLASMGYQDAMTRALAALDSGRLAEADRALQEAAVLRPDDTALRDARRRLSMLRQQSRLEGLRRKAQAREQAEDWEGAAGHYREALKVDSKAAFANDGLAHAMQRARLHEQIDHYLDEPARLYSREPLANAGQLLDTAASAPGSEPQLAGKLERLQRLVTEARTPVPVSLRSDGKTDVVIYHVGRLGRFENHAMQLPPGDYTVVGSRTGYRDVRRTLSVRPGRPGMQLVIRCEEPV